MRFGKAKGGIRPMFPQSFSFFKKLRKSVADYGGEN
jgi:hypothetical protein